ncbi:hypothetical protein GCM10028784_36900 [Myceligenerans cantabricum]
MPIDVEHLLLDWANPRLAAEDHDPERSQADLVAIMDRKYNALAVAQSIARHGFFPSEPLIAIVEGDNFRVLEGNRRLAALKGMRDDQLRERLAQENRGWSRLDVSRVPARVPVLIVEREEDVDPLLGFRHISGIDPWSPYQQAQFIAKLVDEREMPLEAVADVVGRPLTEVRSMYRDFDILRRGQSLKVDVKSARDRFGVFTAAMGRPAIRAFIGASDPAEVDPEYEPFEDEKAPEFEELLGFLFGSPTETRVVGDSRQIKDLVAVFRDESGAALQELRATRDLGEALSALGQPDAQVTRALSLANRHLRRAIEATPGALSAEAVTELSTAQSLIEQLTAKSEATS